MSNNANLVGFAPTAYERSQNWHVENCLHKEIHPEKEHPLEKKFQVLHSLLGQEKGKEESSAKCRKQLATFGRNA